MDDALWTEIAQVEAEAKIERMRALEEARALELEAEVAAGRAFAEQFAKGVTAILVRERDKAKS